MDNQNQNQSGSLENGSRVQSVFGPDLGGTGVAPLESEALSANPNSLAQQPLEAQLPAPRSIARVWTKLLRRADLVVLALIIIGAATLVITSANKDNSAAKNNSANVAGQYSTQEIPLNAFVVSNSGITFGASNVVINGALKVNNGLVITPTVQPNAPTAGQLYYDQNTNEMAYFNGTAYVPLTASGPVVQSIGGITGALTLSGGLSVVGNQLTTTQSGVTSFGGSVGAISVGGGLNMVGNTLQNTGVLNVIAGSSIAVTNDGKGDYTVNNIGAGTGTVTSSGGTSGTLPMFTASQNIEDSLITQSGTMITITGDLNVVTGGLSLGNALTVSNGGTGAASLAANGVVVAAGTAPFTSVVAGSPGLCFVSTAGVPTFAACPSATGVSSLNGLTGAVSLANASAAGSTVTIDNASTVAKGIASFNPTNFSASAGAINTIQDINTTATPTFGRLTVTSAQNTNPMLLLNNTDVTATGNLIDLQQNGLSRFSVQPNGNTSVSGTINGQTISASANLTGTLNVAAATTLAGVLNANGGAINSTGALNITPGGTLTVGATGQTLALQGNASTTLAAVNGGNTTTVSFQAPTANVTYRFATTTTGNYDVCTTAGNCVGAGGGVTTLGGTTNRLSKFTGASTVGDSSISDNGSTVTTTANIVIQGGTATIGVPNSQTGSLSLAYGSANFSGVVTVGALTANRTYTLPDADGTVCLSSGNCLGGGGGGANTALSNLSSVAINTSLLPGGTTVDLGSGTAPFRNLYIAGSSLTPGTNNFQITGTATAARTITLPDASGTVCLDNSTNCGFLTGTGAAFVQNGNVFGAAANLGTNDGFDLNLRTSGTTRLTVQAGGDVSFSNNVLINGGQLGGTGGLAINPSGTLTAGTTGQTLTLQGNATTTVSATDSGNTTTVSFQVPTANVTYRFKTTAAGNYDICTTAGNCVGTGGGVSTGGGTTGTIAVFTGAQTIGDSLLSQSGGTVSVSGNIDLSSSSQFRINGSQISSGNLSNDANLAKLSASQTFTGNTVGFKNGADSTNAFNIQNAAGNRIFTIDTTGTQAVLGLASTLNGKLAFKNVTNANTITIVTGTPTADRTLTLPDADGEICTNSGNCAGVGSTLQTAYNFSTGGTTPKIKVDSTLLGVDIQDADTTIGANLFNIRGSNGAGLGAVMFGVGNTGAVTVQNISNSTAALRLLTQGGTSVLTGDTQNGQIILGQGGTLNGTLVFNNATNSNQVTIVSAAVTGPQTVTLPDATGTVCLSSGNCSGAGSSNTLQAAYDAGNTILTSNARNIGFTLADSATDANFLVNLQCTVSCGGNGRFAVQNSGSDVFSVAPNGGSVLFQDTANSTSSFNIKNQGGNNVFTIDTSNSRIGINLGSNTTPSLTNGGLELQGGFRMSGSAVDTFTTPLGASLPARLNIVPSDPGSFGQIVALGLTATAQSTARGITVLDARPGAHQQSIAVFSPDESNAVGFSWNGSNTLAQVQTTDHTAGTNTEGIILQSGSVSGGNGSSGDVQVNSGTIAGGTGGTTGSIYIVSGDSTGTDSSSGNVVLDSGVKTGTGTTGAVNIGQINASSINLGRNTGSNNITTTIQGLAVVKPRTNAFGSLQVQDAAGNQLFAAGGNGTTMQVEIGKPNSYTGQMVFDGAGGANAITLIGQSNPGAARTVTLPDETGTICLQNSANCGFATGSSAAFVQGGNSFGATAVLGTNDNNDLAIRRNTTTKLTVGATSVTLASNISLALQGASATISNPQATTGEAFGAGASTAAGSVVVGNGTSAYNNGVAIGYQAVSSSTNGVSLGYQANGGFLGTALGAGAAATGTGNVAVGNFTSSANSYSIALGYVATTTADYQFVVGGDDGSGGGGISQVVVGNGVTNAAPMGFTLQGTGGSGANIAGASLSIAGGAGTGNANGGDINLQVAAPGSSGSSANVPATVLSLSGTNGAALFQNVVNSANALKVVNAVNSETILSVDTTARSGSGGNLVKIGNSTGTDTALTILQLDAATADPTSNLAALNGGLFYNSTTNKVSLIENGQIKVICNTTDLGCGTGTVTLQNAYANSTGGTTSEIIADATRGALDIQDRSTGNGGTISANLLNIRATAANDSTAGTLLFGVGNTGAVLLQNSADSTTALQVKKAGGGAATVLGVDTTNGRIGINTAAPSADLTFGEGSTRQINVQARSTNAGGNGLILAAGAAGAGASGQAGGDVQINGGAAAGTTGGANGGNIYLQGGLGINGGSSGVTIVKNAADAATAFQVQNAGGTTTAFNVDTSNTRVGIGTSAPSKQLHVVATDSANPVTAKVQNTNGAPGAGTTEARLMLATSATLTDETTGAAVTAHRTGGAGNGSTDLYLQTSNAGSVLNTQVTISSTGAVTARNSADSTAAFQVQNAAGNSFLSVDTTAGSADLVTNGSFETNTTGWAAKGSATLSAVSTDFVYGSKSMQIATTVAADGAKYNVTLSDSTAYSLSFFAKASSTINTAFDFGYSSDGSTENTANITSLSQTVGSSSGWTRFTLNFTTPASHSGTPYIFMKQTDGTARNIFIDGVQLEQTTGVAAYKEGKLQVNGIVTTPLIVQTPANNTAAFVVADSTGTNVLKVDTRNFRVGINNASPTADLSFGSNAGSGRTINVANASSGNNGDSLTLQAGNGNGTNKNGGNIVLQGGTATGSGTIGAVIVKNGSDSTGAFQVQNAGGTTTVLSVDTTNTRVGIGTATASRTLDVSTNDSNTTLPAIRLLQGGSGDATAELNNSVSGYSVGVDTSDSSLFKISSTNASGAASKFGYTSPTWNNTFDSGNNNMITATLVTSGSSAGTLNSISVYVGKVGGTGQMQVGIYSNKTTGCAGGHSNCPNALVANSGNFTLTEYSWNTIPITAAVSGSTKYWLGFNVNSGATNYGIANGVGSDETAFYDTTGTATPFGTWPANYSGANYSTNSSQGGTPYRIYATYTTSTPDTFAGNLFSLSADGAAIFKNSTDSNQALQVKNSYNGSVLSVDTLNNDSSTNLITDGGFEKGVSNWSIKDSGNGPFQRNDQHHSGHAALYVEGTNIAGGGGVKYDITLSDALQYIATFYVKSSTGDAPATTVEAGYNNGTANTPCTQNTSTINSLGWTRIECTITTPASHSGTPHFYIRRTDQQTDDMFIDDVFLSSDYSTFGIDSLRNGGVDIQGVVQSDLRVQQSVNSTTALTVQNQYANTILNVDTTDPNNLILNPSFEKDLTTGLSVFDLWAATGAGTTVARDTSQAYVGSASLKIVTTTTANAGATLLTKNTNPTQLATSTTYTMSWYTKLSSGSFTDIKAGYARDGSTWIDCIPGNQTVVTGGWTRFTCSFTTIATAPTAGAMIRIIQTAGTAHTFWIDAVRLEKGSAANAYGNGSISLDASIISPVSLHNTSDSTTAMQIQNAAGTTFFMADSINKIIKTTDLDVGATAGTQLFSDSFEGNSFTFWDLGSTIGGTSTASIDSTIKRNGNYSAKIAVGSGNDYYRANLKSSAGSIYARAYVYVAAQAGSNDLNLFGVTSLNDQPSFEVNRSLSNGHLELWDGSANPSGTIRDTGVTMTTGSWHKIEIFATAVTGGTVSVYMDGTLANSYVVGSRNGGSPFTMVRIGDDNTGGPTGSTFYVDDISVNNTTTATAENGSLNVQDSLHVGGSTTLGQTIVHPASDSTAAFQIQNAGGNSMFNVDTYNNNITLLSGTNTPLGTWNTNANSLGLATPVYRAMSVTANGYIYYIGGSNGSQGTTPVVYARANSDGSTGAFTATTSLGTARESAGVVVANGYVYLLGGYETAATTNKVTYAKINPDGTLGSWNNTTTLPAAKYRPSAVYANGYIYVIGGGASSTDGSTTVYYGKVNADGTVSSWTTSANTLGAAGNERASGMAVTANGYLYYMGGQNNSTVAQTTVYASQLNQSTGANAAFTTSSMPTASRDGTSVVVNGYVYVLGGKDGSGTQLQTVQYTKLNSDGTLGTWSTISNSLPMSPAAYGSTSVVINGYIYYMGGSTSGGTTNVNTVYYASTARVQIGGSLDLVGIQSTTMTDPGSQNQGSSGGSLTAGNGTFVGSLQVQGQATFNQTVNISGGLVVDSLFAVDVASEKITIGPSAGDTTGAILVLGNRTSYTSHSQVSEPTGVAGAMYYNSALGQFRCYEVDHWRDCLQSARTTYHYTNDYITSASDNTSANNNSGTGGAGASIINSLTGHPGIVDYTTGTNTTGFSGAGSNDSATAYLFGNGDFWRWEAVVRMPTISDGTNTYTVRLGMNDISNADGTNGCFFKYSSGVNGGKWQGMCESGGVQTPCDTGFTVLANTWYRVTMSVNAAGNSTDFQINGGLTNGTDRCQVTSHIPTATTTSWNATITKSAGTTARDLNIDYIDVEGQFGSAR